jgi:adenosylmethionine-8-amino-7-oxononanoate aminotransferase
MARESVIDAIMAGSGNLWNGHTYMSHAVATAGALAVLQEVESRDLLSAVRARGRQLETALRERFGQHAHVGDIRGRGLFWSIELVAERDSKTPFDVSRNLAGKIQRAAMDAGMICYPSQGCADGTAGDHVLLAPAFTSPPDEIEMTVEMLGTAVDQVIAEG